MSEGRAPRPALVHWLVDSAIAFLAIAFVGWIVGLHLTTMVIIAVILGAVATPFTLNTEVRMLEERLHGDADDPRHIEGSDDDDRNGGPDGAPPQP